MSRQSTLGILALVLCAVPALAQEVETPAGEGELAPTPEVAGDDSPSMAEYSFSAGSSYTHNGSLDDAPADVNVTRFGASFRTLLLHDRQWSSFFKADTQYSVYNFEGSLNGFTPGGQQPFDSLYSAGITGGLNYARDERWIYTGALRITSGFGDGGDVNESLTYGGYAGFMYAFDPKVKLGVGLAASTRLDEEFTVLPLPLVEVTIDLSDRLRLDLGTLRGARLGYEVSDTFEVGLGASYDYNEYRLGDSGPAPGGVLREARVPLMLEGVYSPTPDLRISAGISTMIYGQLDIDDSNGLDVASSNVREDLTLHLGFRYTW